jgi:hypothetical protein
MKKLIYLVSIVALVVTSCSKKDGSTDLPHPSTEAEPTVPEHFSKKVLIEELTGAWCGYCPRGGYWFDKIDSTYEGKVIGVSIHVGDVMEDHELVTSSGANMLDSGLFLNTGYPNGSVDRHALMDPTSWMSMFPLETSLYAKCGIAIDASSVSGNTLNLVVRTGFSQTLSSEYHLNVYIVEADVHSNIDHSYDQHNYYSQFSTSPDSAYPYYWYPDPIPDFHHKNVLRKLVSAIPNGDRIPEADMVKGKSNKKTYTVNLAGLNTANCYIVAFVDKYGTDLSQHQIQNVQKVKIGQNKNWD